MHFVKLNENTKVAQRRKMGRRDRSAYFSIGFLENGDPLEKYFKITVMFITISHTDQM
jgi:hypothetical protein